MMRQAIKNHIAQERENFFRERKIKTLSLFFIDSIYSYRGDNGMGSLRESFQNILKENLEEEMKKFKDSPSKIHQEYISFVESSLKDISATNGGYFSEDNSNTDEDIQKEVHQILKDKQSLLNFKNTNGGWNTRRFIFSKWTLREGWDNPNVFQICKLRSSGSEVSKLQEVGRGLRLPIDEYGNRICDEQFYLTYLVDYCEKDFADSLIQEIKQNEKHTSSSKELHQNKVINKNHESGVVNVRKDKFEELRQLWQKINQKYYLLLGDACEEELYKATLNILKEGIEEDVIACTIEKKTSLEDGNLTIKEAVASHYILDKTLPYGEFLKKTQNATGLSVRIMHKALCEYHKIRAIDRMFFNENSLSNFVRKFKAWFEGAFLKRFSYKALNVDSLETALTDVNGEVREKIIQGTIGIIKDDNLAVPENFLYDKVIFDSSKEKESIVNSSMDEVVVFGKIPRRSVQVPLYFGGTTSPDFMYVIKKNNNVEINFIVETKDVDAQSSLRGTEDLKIQASQKFFETLQKDGIPVVFKAQLQNDDIVNMIHKLSL